jgi:hypothetical protein
MIYLETGQPGHGKTLRAMQLALEFKAKGRAVYVHGVRGLDYVKSGFFPLDDPKQWQDLPDGAVIVIDECYSTFPRRMPGAKVPAYVEAMATHRHRGFDFILICQQAKQQLDTFILGLVDRHEHIRRKFGLKSAVILTWDEFSENTKNSQIKKPWKYPADVMRQNLYESTVQDNTQIKVPWFVWALPVTVALLGFLVWRVNAWFHPEPKGKPAPVPVAVSDERRPAAPLAGVMDGGGRTRRPDDLAAWFKPRVAGQPWTAPAYDDRQVRAEPELYCMAAENGYCGCITEQGTNYVIEANLCRAIARNGVYNPYRSPSRSRGEVDRSRDEDQQREREVTRAAGGGGTAWPGGVGASSYVPPAYPGSWNPDALGKASGGR